MSSLSLLQHGGLKQRKYRSPSSGKKEAKPMLKAIEDMLDSPNATFEVLTCSSLKGFMFTLTVTPDHSEFVKQSRPGGKFDELETEFIVKFCITSNGEYGIDEYKFPQKVKKEKWISKETESAQGFLEEAKLQQNIWKNSVSARKEPLCPSVAAFGILRHQTALAFLSSFSQTTSGKTSASAASASARISLCSEPKSKYTIKYLSDQIKKYPPSSSTSFGLGILLMSKIPNSITLDDYLEMHSTATQSDLDARMNVKSMMLAKVIRLFIEGKAIHFDFHPGNGMVILNPVNSELIGTVLIDFGRASSLQNPNADGYLSPAEKQQFLAEINGPSGVRSMSSRSKPGPTVGVGYYDEFFNYHSASATLAQKATYLSKVLKVIIDVEHEKSQAKFHDPTSYPATRYQTQWVEELFEHGQTRATPTGFSIQQRWADIIFQELERTMIVPESAPCTSVDGCLNFKDSDTATTYTHGGKNKSKKIKSKQSKKSKTYKKSHKL